MSITKIKERVLQFIKTDGYRPMQINELGTAFSLPESARPAFLRLLQQMEREGTLTISRSQKVEARVIETMPATIMNMSKRGGFAQLADQSTDVYIDKSHLMGAMPTDEVEVHILRQTDRLPEGEVTRIVKRNFVEFTGTFYREGGRGLVLPDFGFKERIEVDPADLKTLGEHEKVMAQMVRYPSVADNGQVHVLMSYGSADSGAACCQAVLDRRHARQSFPDEVLAEANAIPTTCDPAGRLDLRDSIILTVDSAHSKDLDDAISIEKLEDGYRLGVHIADVSHYVQPGTALNEEAFERGTSIYFGNRVIPMLPEALSNGICSLNPREDRLAFTVFIDVDAAGDMQGYTLHKSIIRSYVKGVYDELNEIYAATASKDLLEKYKDALPSITLMRELAERLQEARKRRGAIDFDSDDCEVVFNEQGVAVDIVRRTRGISERMIEEFMLLANEAVATFASEKKLPFVYRVHEEPDALKLENFAASLAAVGINNRKIRPGLAPGDLAEVLHQIEGTPKERALNQMALRTMAKAKYWPECLGHFGLALKYYSQFTSPIRRYPDLSIHRILSELLEKTATPEEISNRYESFVTEASEQSSEREVNAMQIEWDCDDIYKAEYMLQHVGGTFPGTITGVKSYGFYVELENTVEGLVRVETLKGWFDYDEKNMQLFCTANGRRYSIGDSVNVLATRVEVALGQVDFELA
ncbi:MAG: ribonuclease R [Ethanoligenens sp.]